MDKKEYVTPEMEITGFDVKDIIATSTEENMVTNEWSLLDTPFYPLGG